jgi:hypothetical protein
MKPMRLSCICIFIFAATLFSCNKPHKQYEIRNVELMRVGSWSDSGAQYYQLIVP